MQRFSPFGAVITVLFSAVLVHTSPAQNVGTARVNGAPQINSGTVDGNVQQMTGANVTLNGGAVITGDLLVPGTPTLIKNGTPNFGGTIVGTGSTSPSNYQVILNGSVRLGHLRTRTNPVAIPALSPVPSPTGTRSVTITAAGQSAGSFSTLRNLTLNGNVGQYAIPAGTYGDFIANGGSGFTLGVAGATQAAVYNFQHLTLNGQTNIIVLGPVVINVANGFTANGAAGTSANPARLKLNIVAGGFTLNGGCTIYGYVTAPNGTVIINGAAKLVGGCISAGLTVNANGLLQLFDVQSFENHPPVAANQAVTTSEDTAKAIILSATDPDGQTLTYSVVSQPAHGSLNGTPPQLTYTPTHGYYGADSFTFKANDGQADSNIATVSITVTHVNHAPVANAQSRTLDQGASTAITLTGSDADNDPLTFRTTSSPAHGALSGTSPNLTYTPAQNFYGTDSFTFVANDGAVDSPPATVSITVNHVNHPPVAAGQSVQTNEDTAAAILLSAADVDSDPLTYSVLTSPTHGTLSGAAPSLTYTPAAHFFGSDSFTFRANDGSANSNTATVQITVVHVNHPPTANGQNISLDEDTTAAISLTGNDPDGDAITFSIVVQPAHGTLTGSAPNVVYTPAPDYFGTDSFAFRTNDGSANSQNGVVNITVRPVNDPPAVQISTPSSGAQFDAGDTVHIVATASDIDGTIATFRLLLDGAVVSERLQTSTVTFDLLDVGAGDHSISALVIDNEGASAASTQVLITVHSQGNGPVQVNAGPDRLISLPSTAHLDGSVTVNGAPAGSDVQLAWQKNSGPGNATFDNSAALQPTVTFDAPGIYVLKLVATAPEGTGFDTVKVTVLAAPQAGPDSPVSNQGREFWMTFLSNPSFHEPTWSGANLNISSETAATGTVEIFASFQIDGNWQVSRQVKTFSVAAGGKTVVDVNSGPDYGGQYDQARSSSVHIVADAPVAVHALNYKNATTDGSLILPTSLLGLDHFVMSYRNGETSTRLGSECAIVATKAQTSVTITPASPTGPHPAGQPFTVTLQTGEVYRLISGHNGEDLTGTRVQADKPIAVYGGHTLAYVPFNVPYADHLYEQIPPVDLWGRHFVTVPLRGRNGGDLFRLLASNDNTHVSINGQVVGTLNRGQFYETILTQPASILADQRILVGQLAQGTNVDHTTGDPFLSLVPPYETFGRHYIMPTPYFQNYDRVHNTYVVSDIFDSYLTLVVDSAHAADVRVNGQPVDSAQFFPIADTGFSAASISVPKNSTVDVSSPTPVGTLLYGWAPFESYGYTGGLYGAIDSATAQFTLTQSASAAPVGSSHRVRAQLINSAGLTVPDARVSFSVTGANPTSGSGFTAPDGSVEFSWQGAQAGVDTVTATCGALTATVSVNWMVPGANQPPQVNAGADVLVTLGQPLVLHGVVQDDGHPSGNITLQWSTLPGPGDVTFADPASADTTASFIYPGQYRLRLTAYDGQFAGDDDLLVTVDIPPAFIALDFSAVVDAGSEWRVGISARDEDGLIARIELIEGDQVLDILEPNTQVVSYYYTILSTVFTTTGPHSLTVRLTDNQGATADSSLTVTVRPAPTVQILSPADNTSVAAGDSVSFTASASSAGGSIVRVVYSEVTNYPYEIGDGTGSNYQLTWTPSYTGTYLIAATAYDSEGASGTSAPITVTVLSPGDPTVIITSPQAGSSIYLGQSTTLRADAAAVAPAIVDGVVFYDGNNYLGWDNSPPYEASWFGDPAGAHSLRADVYDSFGGYASTSITVNVIEPPDLSITLVQPPPNIPIKVNTPTTLEAAIENVIGTLQGVQFYVNGQWIGGGSSSSVTWTPTTIGEYQIGVYAYSYDPYQDGYTVTSVTVADLHSPVVQWIAPANNASFAPNTPIVLQAQASDIDSNLSKLQFLADGQLLSETPLSGGAGVASCTWDNAGPGWHTLTALAVDDTLQSSGAFLRVFVERTVANDLLPPTALTSEATSPNGIHLAWTPSISTNSTATALERRAGTTGTWEEIATIDTTLASYEDNALEPETYYSYRLAALDASGARSNYSSESSATTKVQVPQYAVIDLGESLDQSFVALNLIEKGFLYAKASGTFPSAAVLDLKDADVMSIDEANNVLLKKRDTTSNGGTTIEYYFLWHLDGRDPDFIGDPRFRAFRLSRDGVVAGAVDHSTVNQSDVPDWIYRGLEFWSGVGSLPGTVRNDGTRIDVRAATWTAAGGVHELVPADERDYRYDRLDLSPPRMLPSRFDSLFSAWDVSTDGTVVGSGSWSDLRGIDPSTPLNTFSSYELFTFPHGMRWRNGSWDTLGSLRRQSSSEGESIATAINPLGTIVVGGSAAPDRAGDPPVPTHAMRSQMIFAFRPFEPGDPALQDLAPLGTGSYSWAWDVDAAGDAVGYSTKNQSDPISQTHAAYWNFGSNAAFELPNLGGRNTTYFPEGYGYANAINAVGDRIVGKSITTDGFTAGTVWALNANNGGNSRSWEAHDLNQHVPSDWYVVNAVDINRNGFVVGIGFHTVPDPANPNGPPIQQRRSVLLLPLELKDIKKVADQNDDVEIEAISSKTSDESENAYIQRSLSNKQIAYIEPHGAINDTDPEMPHLVAKLPRGPYGLKVRWKLLVEYKRGNGYRASYVNDFTRPEDTVKFPASGEYTAEMDADQEWRIFESEDWTNEIEENGFFGGTAKLYMWFPSQGAEPTEPLMTFRIGGKNPDQAAAKTFINGAAGSQFSYAYAIAKHETYGRIRENGQIRFYNQFYTDYKQGPIGDASVDMGLAAWAKGWPLYNLDRDRKKDGTRYQNGPGGYGMYQLTLGPKLPNTTIPTGGEQFIKRKEIWNWQDNVRGTITELRGKLSAAQSMHSGLQSAYPEWPAIPNEGYLSGLDAIVVTYYNGTGGLPLTDRAVNGSIRKSCWKGRTRIQGGTTRFWQFYQNSQNYVQSVNGQIE